MSGFEIFEDGWIGTDTVCGWGSRMEHTNNVRHDLPNIVQQIRESIGGKVKVNDAGCGDLWWLQKIVDEDLWDYVGYDLYPRDCWDELPYDCRQLNVCSQHMRECDLIICRDVFIHWPTDYILWALDRFRDRSKYLYSTSYTGEYFQFSNHDRITDFSMSHSKLNLCSAPFNLGQPLWVTMEDYENHLSKKVICLWELKQD